MNTEILVDMLIFSGSFLALLIGIGQLLLKRKDHHNYLLTSVFFSMAVYQFCISVHLVLTPALWFRMYPVFGLMQLLSLYLLIPFTYLYFRHLSDVNFRFSIKQLLHLIPAFLCIVFIILWVEYPASGTLAPRDYIGYVRETVSISRIVGNGTIIQGLIYIVVLVKYYFKRYSYVRMEKKHNFAILLIVLIFGGGGLLVCSLSICSGLVGPEHKMILYYLCNLRFTIFTMSLFLVSWRSPFVLHVFDFEALRDYYKKSQLSDKQVAGVVNGLERLMDEEGIYYDSKLTLRKTADLLEIKSYQLSEILNNRLEKNFNSYVNEKRIAAACELLKSHPDMKVIEVSCNCGFHSLSIFNTAFKAIIGCTPSEYRKR